MIRPSEIAEILTAAPQAQIQANLLSGPIRPSDLAIRGFLCNFLFLGFGLFLLKLRSTLFTVIIPYGEPYRRKANVSKFLYRRLRLIYVKVFRVEGLTKLRNIEGDMSIFVNL